VLGRRAALVYGNRDTSSNLRYKFGVNLNNREPLIAPDYDVQMLLDLSSTVEEAGFDSVWVGDSLFSKPRYEPIALLSALAQHLPWLQPVGISAGLHGYGQKLWCNRGSTNLAVGAAAWRS
jgi:hypothetical protein